MHSQMYRKLDRSRQEIRLFELLPADNQDSPVRGRLHYHSLADKPVYNTISYVWGKPSLTDKEIEVDGKSLQVTPNLHKVLRNLRYSQDHGTLFWIDAICINQQDLAERNHQVGMMRQIYEQCGADRVWLGPTSDSHEDDEEAMEAGLQLLGKICANDIRTLQGLGYGFPDLDSTEKTWNLTDEDISALEHVLVHPEIWYRIWVVQELACAANVILMAGNARLEWDRVAQFLGPLPPSDAFHRQFGSHGNLVRRDLSTLLVQLKRIHDQLLGLAPRELRLPVDYSKTLPAVHLDAVRAIIDYSANLDIIAQNSWRQDKKESIPRREPDRKLLLQLPSWVPTFSVPLRAADQRRRLLFAQRGIFNAGPPTCQIPCHITDDGALRTRGVVLDTVGKEIPGQGLVRSRPRDPLPHISMHACASRDLLDASCPTYVSGEPAFTAYWRTLATDRTGFPMSRLQAEQIATLDRTLRERMEESMSRHAVSSELNTGSTSTLIPSHPPLSRAEDGDWGFNVTTRGLYAMVLRGSAQQGDTIACLEGAKVPLVLRRREADETSMGAPPRFEVIGSAYVHRFMDGEAFDSVELRERMQLKTEKVFLV
ncbi:Heterokaryon incompatibility protein [Apiospora sp. TS-2023a]